MTTRLRRIGRFPFQYQIFRAWGNGVGRALFKGVVLYWRRVHVNPVYWV